MINEIFKFPSSAPTELCNRSAVAGLDCGEGTVVLELYQRQLRLARLLVDEVVVVLGRDVERVPLLSVELEERN